MTADLVVPDTAELARRVVAVLAPHEVAGFDLLAAPYLAHPRRAERELVRHPDDPLGFGPADALATVTPVVTLVCGSVATALLQGATKEARRFGARMTRRLLGRLGRGRKRPVAVPGGSWTAEQLADVRTVALAKAKALGVKNREAEAMADAIVGALVLKKD